MPGKPVLGPDVGPKDFQSYRTSQVSPLASSIFKIEGVTGVFLSADSISVNIKESFEWSVVKPEVFAAISDFYASGQPALLSRASEGATCGGGEKLTDTTITEADSEIVAMIKELIETRIRPTLQDDGGNVVFHRFDETTGKVLLQMQGSCVGCPSSQVTLKSGIENMIKHYVPEVTGVEEVQGDVLGAVNDEALKKLEDNLAKIKECSHH